MSLRALRRYAPFLLIALLVVVAACVTAKQWSPGVSATAPVGDAPGVAVPGTPIAAGYTVGEPGIFDNLAVFPIFASVQEDLGEFTTLEAALENGTAEVRELDAAPSAPGEPVQQRAGGDGARVNSLLIENRGKLPLLVLAGTVVKGGKQDRQIGGDFVIGAGKTVPVDAFCVEHGRWNGHRDGVATGGKFTSSKVLAQGDVRGAGQYKKDQQEVWDSVSKVNKAHGKEAPSDTLMATLDDGEVAAARTKLAGEVHEFLNRAEPQPNVVGLAYAVDGEVRAVRWFLNHRLFTMHSETLVNTAAVEAITAKTARKGAPPAASLAVAPAAVTKFVDEIQNAKVEERPAAPAADNAYEYQESDQGYGSKAVVQSKGKPKAVTQDFLKKK
jgi:hypothetical protein